jgi:hypothetical protein
MVWGLGVVIISAPQVFLRPRVGLDASWEVAMQMASRLGLQWGTQIAWTYGPYGYTDQAIYVYFRTWLLAAVVAVVVHVLYCGVLGLFLWQAKIGIWGWSLAAVLLLLPLQLSLEFFCFATLILLLYLGYW